MAERDLETYLRNKARTASGEVRKVRWIGRRNAPDDLVLLRGRHFYIELKVKGKRPTAAQEREHNRMRRSKMNVEWANTKEGIDDIFTRYCTC